MQQLSSLDIADLLKVLQHTVEELFTRVRSLGGDKLGWVLSTVGDSFRFSSPLLSFAREIVDVLPKHERDIVLVASDLVASVLMFAVINEAAARLNARLLSLVCAETAHLLGIYKMFTAEVIPRMLESAKQSHSLDDIEVFKKITKILLDIEEQLESATAVLKDAITRLGQSQTTREQPQIV